MDFFERWFMSEKVEVKKDPKKGRHLIAKVNIPAGENFFNCPPFACAVHEKTKTYVCQFCFLDLKRETNTSRWDIFCGDCRQVWYCSPECKEQDQSVHAETECESLQRFNDQKYDPDIATEVRVLLRLMGRIAPKKNMTEQKISLFYPSAPGQPLQIPASNFMIPPPASITGDFSIKALEFWQLISNSQALIDNGTMSGLTSVVEYAISLLPESARLSFHDTMEYYCKIRCNMFGVGGTYTEELVGYGVYVEASFFNHSCAPNVSLSRDYKSLVHQFWSMKEIEAGAELNITYIDDLTKNTEHRRAHLQDNYFFHCVCSRCIQPKDSVPDFICGVDDCKGFLVPSRKSKALKRQCNVCFRWET
eukprot:TRINITY_DN8464_c0_g1_i1.p1 TRINITY_DN8464_c0_g1~~TRINITY_DN8464_c0_g1_i1.p1  ORF type:complete len:363 (+),score=77.84 TRINITY_DN8464_c0_g1_i1:1238-2326(+)